MNRTYHYIKMSKRINALDYVRVVAILMILLCHYFLFSDLNTGIGRYLGGTGTMVFFLLSAFLYGLKYEIDSQTVGGGGNRLIISDLR